MKIDMEYDIFIGREMDDLTSGFLEVAETGDIYITLVFNTFHLFIALQHNYNVTSNYEGQRRDEKRRNQTNSVSVFVCLVLLLEDCGKSTRGVPSVTAKNNPQKSLKILSTYFPN